MADTSTIDRATGAKPFGPVAAAFLAAGVGAVALGILVILAEASSGIHDALELNTRVGPLSGKTVFAVLAWLVAWVILHIALRDKDPDPKKVFIWTGVMFGFALLLTFPPIFLSFAAE
jgi:hypothetical protein